MSDVMVRNFVRGEEEVLLGILDNAFGSFMDPTQPRRVMASELFDPEACFIAEDNHSPIGCIALTRLPRERWYVVRYLAVRPSSFRAQVAEKLLDKVLESAESKRPEFVRATTPAIMLYVDVYKRSGFRPVRRDVRLTWDLTEGPVESSVQITMKQVEEETAREAADIFASSLAPIWDWRTTEQKGTAAVKQSFIDGVKNGEEWMLGIADGRTVGLAGIIPDYYKPGEARFRGAYVLDEHRGRGFGMALMREISRLATEKGQTKMTVYTFSYLDCLAPGALLYLRSGGRIDAEYLQLGRG